MRVPQPISTLTLTVALAVAPVLAAAAAADTRLEMKSHTDAFQMMGQSQPAQDKTITFWFTDDRVLRDDGENAFLYRSDQNKLYLIDHPAETFSTLSLPIDFLALLPAETRAQMEGFLDQMSMNATVTPTDERKEINGWSSRRYDVHMENQLGMKLDSTVWATEEIGTDLGAFRGLFAARGALEPGGASAVDELLKVQGIPVVSETTIEGMGGKFASKEELVSAEQAAAPAGTYEVPAGYTEVTFNPMGNR
ncbi:MAG TPA: DUF4412 domain-containing protein [Thermoanaerobaculia bacterium]|nr:DUF4412 domain-containing protein [Thermoanaerobaculia bacterium]